MLEDNPLFNGCLPSERPGYGCDTLRRFLRAHVDQQFNDLRVLLLLPDARLAPDVGANFAATALMLNQISGMSVWFLHTPEARRWRRETRRNRGRLFKAFVEAFFPRQDDEPEASTTADVLYSVRNLLSHDLGIEPDPGVPSQDFVLAKSARSTEDVALLEMLKTRPPGGPVVRWTDERYEISVPGLYWALNRMLQCAVTKSPRACEAEAKKLLGQLDRLWPEVNDDGIDGAGRGAGGGL